ncbi:hypothetical protein TREES_T100009780 [Tupaia chinensis]|uniref:Uncharacterized protein n=1 Tax=Tupaia chinensis TaxID=246437 RepID=L9KVK4_TUPCH|nr:hypothetical protein TREES_T100009780 [Tupaia chinensis]
MGTWLIFWPERPWEVCDILSTLEPDLHCCHHERQRGLQLWLCQVPYITHTTDATDAYTHTSFHLHTVFVDPKEQTPWATPMFMDAAPQNVRVMTLHGMEFDQ